MASVSASAAWRVSAAAVGGIALGVLGTVAQQSTVGAAQLPLGLIVALIGIACYLVGLRLVFETRIPALAAAVGLIVAIAFFSLPGPGGSVLVPAGVVGELWEYLPAAIALVAVAWPGLSAKGRA